MGALITPPTPASLSTAGHAYQNPNFNPLSRLALLIECKIVMLKYKGGTNYVGNHAQLEIDSLAAFNGFTPEAWQAMLGDSSIQTDPNWIILGWWVQLANYRDPVNMPATVAAQMLLLGKQMARPTQDLKRQNAYLDYLIAEIGQ